MANGNDSTLLLDAPPGSGWHARTEALGADESRLLADGTLVRARSTGLLDSAIVAALLAVRRPGRAVADRRGFCARPSTSPTAPSGFVLTADGLGVDGVGAYRPGSRPAGLAVARRRRPGCPSTPPDASSCATAARSRGSTRPTARSPGCATSARCPGLPPPTAGGSGSSQRRRRRPARPRRRSTWTTGTVEWELPLPEGTTPRRPAGHAAVRARATTRLVALR